jgi:asparagine N-glycosylation enzyme membrane subunit Stt3
MLLIASFCYAMSIFIDVFTYHLKCNIHDNNNLRYLFSLINIFQFSARAFVLVFIPIMAYYTETIKDIDIIWNITLLAHIFVIVLLVPLFSKRFSVFLSHKVIFILNYFLGKSKEINLVHVQIVPLEIIESKKYKRLNSFYFFVIAYFSGLLFSFSITFLYYLSFFYPQKALTLTSYSQILNMVGTLLLLLLIDPKIMSSIDSGRGHSELRILTSSRILVHITLIILLYILKWWQ